MSRLCNTLVYQLKCSILLLLAKWNDDYNQNQVPFGDYGKIQCCAWLIMKWPDIPEVVKLYPRLALDITAHYQRKPSSREIAFLGSGNTEGNLTGADLHSWESEVLSPLENAGLCHLLEDICYFSDCFHNILRCMQHRLVNLTLTG